MQHSSGRRSLKYEETYLKGAISTRITNPDFTSYAESFGIKGFKPKILTELEDQLSAAITCRELAVVEVMVDPQVNHDLVSKLQTFWEDK